MLDPYLLVPLCMVPPPTRRVAGGDDPVGREESVVAVHPVVEREARPLEPAHRRRDTDAHDDDVGGQNLAVAELDREATRGAGQVAGGRLIGCP